MKKIIVDVDSPIIPNDRELLPPPSVIKPSRDVYLKAMHGAAVYGRTQILEAMLKTAPALVNAPIRLSDDESIPLLMRVLTSGFLEPFNKLLVEYEADVNWYVIIKYVVIN